MKLLLKEWMELRNVSQAQIAAGLSVSRATVSAWVEGRPKPGGGRIVVFPDHESLEVLCRFLECTPNDLLHLQRRTTPSGLTWRDFKGPRGRGRPPHDEDDSSAEPAPVARGQGKKIEAGSLAPAAAREPAPPVIAPVVATPTQRQLELSLEIPLDPAPLVLREPWVRLSPSPFIPEGQEFGPLRPQAIGMARGRVVQFRRDRGLLDIDGYRYEFVDKRFGKLKGKFPFTGYLDQEISFFFWPTLTPDELADRAPDDPPIINLSSLRPSVPESGFVQVLGLIDLIAEDHVRFIIHAPKAEVVIYVLMLGRYTGTVGDLVQAIGRLREGVIHLERWHPLRPELASGVSEDPQ